MNRVVGCDVDLLEGVAVDVAVDAEGVAFTVVVDVAVEVDVDLVEGVAVDVLPFLWSSNSFGLLPFLWSSFSCRCVVAMSICLRA